MRATSHGFFRRLAGLFAVIFMAGALAPLGAAAAVDPAVTGRSDFLFGVNGHNRNYAAYPERNLEQQIRLAAELGSKIYRFNYTPSTLDELEYLDRVVATAKAYGMELMLVTGNRKASLDEIENSFRMLARRYDGTRGFGHIRYIQIYNEVDNALIGEKYPNGGEGDGSTARDYLPESLQAAKLQFQAAIRGIRSGCAETKAVINCSFLHTYLMEYLMNNGVEWDIIGLDWYSNMGEIDRVLPTLISKFPHDIMICETNVWPRQDGDYDTNVTYLPELMKQVYRYNTRIKGLIVYELLDEMAFETAGKFNQEAHFGLVHCDKEGNIGQTKPAYAAVQRLLGGGKVTPTYPKTTAAPQRTTTAARKPDPTTKPATPAVTTKGTTKKAEPTRPQGGDKATTTRAATPKPGTSSTAAAPSGETIDPAATTTAIDTPVGPVGTAAATTGAAARTTSPGTGGGFNILFVIIPVAVVLLAGAGVAAYLLYRRKSNDRPPLP